MASKVRILYYYPFVHFDTGSPKAMVQFIDTLDRAVFEPVYCANANGPLVEVLRDRNVEIVSGSSESLSFRRPLAALSALRRQADQLGSWRIDLVHANCFPWNTDLIVAAWLKHTPVILHVHNPVDVIFQNVVRFAARKVLFPSRFSMQNCGHLERVADRAEVLYNMVDTQAFSRGHAIRDRLGVGNDEIAIGTIAQVSHRKGIDILLDTARRLLEERDDLVFLVAGPVAAGEEEYGRRMMAAAEESPLAGRVRFLGSRADTADFLASLDLFVLPTRAEPLGIVVLEAMAAGVPVLASMVGGIPEIITSTQIGRLVVKITPEGFVEGVREMLALPDRGRAIGEAGRRSLTGRFDVGTGGEMLKRIYFDAVGRS
jgi:glycosyltransferase involved in cell wall biosynthesis